MLRKFRVKNFLSFRDWQTLDLTVAANAPDLPGRFVQSIPGSRDRFPTFVAIFGANASGKTNILRALTFVFNFIQSSQNDSPNQRIRSIPFFGSEPNDDTSEFEVEIDGAVGEMKNRVRFNYNLVISPNQTQVLEEELKYFPLGRPRRLFFRRGQKIEFGDDFQIRSNDPSIKKIRKNSSAISTLAQFNHTLSVDILTGLSSLRSNVAGIMGNHDFSIDAVSNFYSMNPNYLNDFVAISGKFDLNIEKVEISRSESGLTPMFFHRGVSSPVLHAFESHGTNKIFSIFPILNNVLQSGSVAFVDELDNSIHSLLLPEIIELFIDPEQNPYNAQLVSVCQNPSILQHLNKEEVFFVEKAPDGASTIYGMKEIKGVRRESNIYANYLAGAFGECLGSRKVRFRRVKRPVFVACEGKSETGYIRWLNRLTDAQGVPVAFTARNMKGGDPVDIVNRTIRFLRGSIGGPRTYRGKYLFLDRDLSVNSRQVLDRAARLAEKHSLRIVWQHICHEGFLLKHFSETENRNPPNARACEIALIGVWPDYRKGLDAIGYEGRLTIENLARARGKLPDLDAFLIDIGWN